MRQTAARPPQAAVHVPSVTRCSSALSPSTTTRASASPADDQSEVARWSSYYYARRQRGRSDSQGHRSTWQHRHHGCTEGEAAMAPHHKKSAKKKRSTGQKEDECDEEGRAGVKRHATTAPTVVRDTEDDVRRDQRATRQAVQTLDIHSVEEQIVLAAFITHTRRRWSNPKKQGLDAATLFRKIRAEKRAPQSRMCDSQNEASVAQRGSDVAVGDDHGHKMEEHGSGEGNDLGGAPRVAASACTHLNTLADVHRVLARLCTRGVLTTRSCHSASTACACASSHLTHTPHSYSATQRFHLARSGMDAILQASASSALSAHLVIPPPPTSSVSGCVASSAHQRDSFQMASHSRGQVTANKRVGHIGVACRGHDHLSSVPHESLSDSAPLPLPSREVSIASPSSNGRKTEPSITVGEVAPVTQTAMWTEHQLQTVLQLLQNKYHKRAVKHGLSVMQLWSYLQLSQQVTSDAASGVSRRGAQPHPSATAAPLVFHNRKELYLALNVLVERGQVRVVHASPYPAEAKYGIVT